MILDLASGDVHGPTAVRKRRCSALGSGATEVPSHLCGRQMHVVSGNIVNGKAAYQDFLTLLKNATPTFPS
jgi:hypothetical protein